MGSSAAASRKSATAPSSSPARAARTSPSLPTAAAGLCLTGWARPTRERCPALASAPQPTPTTTSSSTLRASISPARASPYTPANAANTSGTLTVTDGTHSASVVLVGNYTSANFSSTDDGHGHVKITDPAGAMPQSANIALFGHYIAGSFAGGGINGATVITPAD